MRLSTLSRSIITPLLVVLSTWAGPATMVGGLCMLDAPAHAFYECFWLSDDGGGGSDWGGGDGGGWDGGGWDGGGWDGGSSDGGGWEDWMDMIMETGQIPETYDYYMLPDPNPPASGPSTVDEYPNYAPGEDGPIYAPDNCYFYDATRDEMYYMFFGCG